MNLLLEEQCQDFYLLFGYVQAHGLLCSMLKRKKKSYCKCIEALTSIKDNQIMKV